MGAPFGAGEVWNGPWRGEPLPQRGGNSSAKGNALVRPSPATLPALKGRNSTRNRIHHRGLLIFPPNPRVERLTRAWDCGAWRKGSAPVGIHFPAQILPRSRQKKRLKCRVLCRFARWQEASTHLHTYALLGAGTSHFSRSARPTAPHLPRPPRPTLQTQTRPRCLLRPRARPLLPLSDETILAQRRPKRLMVGALWPSKP